MVQNYYTFSMTEMLFVLGFFWGYSVVDILMFLRKTLAYPKRIFQLFLLAWCGSLK